MSPIAAKTAEPHPKLPGTIYSAAEEIEAAGGKALPVLCDIRDEAQVPTAVARTVDAFGGIDICVNNASAIQLTGTLETDMKRYDLMHQINTRGTFLVSKMCIPHLKQAEQPAHPEFGAAARHEGQMVQGPRRLHDGQVRHVDVHAGHERRVRQGRHRRQLAVAADRIDTAAVRNLLGGDDGGGDEPLAGHHRRRRARDPHPARRARSPAISSSTRRCCGPRGDVISAATRRAPGTVRLAGDFFVPDWVFEETDTEVIGLR